MTSKPTAFVIMPFDDELEPVYTQFIKPVLEDEGFDVERADDIESQQNIIKDILDKIRSSDLIIADLTYLNPNVFYELGLAHAFRKPVLLLTQSIDEVPFDLKSYRLLEYSTHFAEIASAQETLKSYAEGSREGNIDFGSPVTDFVPIAETPHIPSATSTDRSHSDSSTNSSEQDTEVETLGFLDHQVALTDGYGRIAEIVAGATTDMQTLTQHVENTTAEANAIGSHPNASSPRAARNIFRRLATRVNDFNSKMKKHNAEFADVLEKTEDSLEHMVAFLIQNPDVSDVSEEKLNEFHDQLEDFEKTGTEAKAACLFFADIMGGLPKIENRLNRAASLGSEELRVLATNLDRTVASMSRAKQIIADR